MKDNYIYPAIFSYEDDGISISFPDLEGCFTCAKDDEEAYLSSKEVLGLYMVSLEEEKKEIPKATCLKDIVLKENERSQLVSVWMPRIRRAVENKAIKKTLSIPQWLDVKAREEDLNFSYILQQALKKELGV